MGTDNPLSYRCRLKTAASEGHIEVSPIAHVKAPAALAVSMQ
jgi:hypothetical protein